VSALAGHAGDYLQLRRALGFKLTRQGQELAQLVRFCQAAGASTLTADLAITWARQSRGAPVEWAHRLATARGFARYLATIDPMAEIPPAGVFPRTSHRRVPYLYSDEDVARVLEAAAGLTPQMRAATCVTVIGLLAATGLRAGEALALACGDVDLAAQLLTITTPKLDRPRLVPLHPTVWIASRQYPRMDIGRRQHQAAGCRPG
jgi:integrase/recombinase XerD